jgi:cobaltochelatase CobN
LRAYLQQPHAPAIRDQYYFLNGLLTPQQLDQFKMVIAKATGRTQEENEAAQSKKARESLKKTIEEIQKEESVKAENGGEKDRRV